MVKLREQTVCHVTITWQTHINTTFHNFCFIRTWIKSFTSESPHPSILIQTTRYRVCSDPSSVLDWWNFCIILLTNQQSTNQQTRCKHGLLCGGHKQHYILKHDNRPVLRLKRPLEVLSFLSIQTLKEQDRPETPDLTDKHQQRQSQEVLTFTNTEYVERFPLLYKLTD